MPSNTVTGHISCLLTGPILAFCLTDLLLRAAPLDEELAQRDKSGTIEGPFLAAFQPLTRNLVRP